ncbi:MAG: RNase J family beta-CASP ribonuclease [Nanoarchaeota archaeon]
MIELLAVGGYDEVGRNMTALKVGEQVVLFDMGVHLENYIRLTEDEDIIRLSPELLIKENAVPNITKLGAWQKKVCAIIPTHAHLDHVGAIPLLSNQFDADIICTPFASAVIRSIVRDEGLKLKNKIRELNVNSRIKVHGLDVEFINMTHSTPQTVMVALHTPKGIVLYANDFKFDMYPVLGQKPDFKRLEELGRQGVLALIVDSTYAGLAQKMPSETVAKEMLRDVMLGTDARGKAIIVTTFSSHLARLKSIIEFGKKLNRKVIFLGRSLAKYTLAGEEVGIVNFSKEVEVVKYSSKIGRSLKRIMREGKHKYVMVVTGHQGEPKSTLAKMASGELPFRFDREDHVIFACKVIPTPTNEANRAALEQKLRYHDIRIFTDIHISGHAAREDLRDLIKLVRPKHVIPAHGDLVKRSALKDLALQMGYASEKSVHLLKNGDRLQL